MVRVSEPIQTNLQTTNNFDAVHQNLVMARSFCVQLLENPALPDQTKQVLIQQVQLYLQRGGDLHIARELVNQFNNLNVSK